MSGTLLTVLVGAVSVSVAVAAFFAATRATRSQAQSADHAVDAAAYGRATDIYESTITALRAEVKRLTDEVRAARTEIHDVRDDLGRLQAANDRMGDDLARLHSQEHDDLTGYRTRETSRLAVLREREFRDSAPDSSDVASSPPGETTTTEGTTDG